MAMIYRPFKLTLSLYTTGKP